MNFEFFESFALTVDHLAKVAQALAIANWILMGGIGAVLLRKRLRSWTSCSSVLFLFAGLDFLFGMVVACARIQFFQLVCIQTAISQGGGFFSPELASLNIICQFKNSVSPFILSGLDLIFATIIRYYQNRRR